MRGPGISYKHILHYGRQTPPFLMNVVTFGNIGQLINNIEAKLLKTASGINGFRRTSPFLDDIKVNRISKSVDVEQLSLLRSACIPCKRICFIRAVNIWYFRFWITFREITLFMLGIYTRMYILVTGRLKHGISLPMMS